MRIALVSTMRTAVPPPKTGSVELIVGLMAEELVRRGHTVTVFAPGDSTVGARVVSILPTGYHHDLSIWDWQLAEFIQLGKAYEHAAEFDVINSHVYCYGLPFSRLVKTPTVHTFHICPTPDFVRFCAMYPEDTYVLISKFQRQFFDGVPVAGVVHNGIDTSSFPFWEQPGSYLVFLGDFHPDKGPLESIRFARTVGVPLKLAGPPTDYFRTVIEPEIARGGDIEYIGEVNHDAKVELLGNALALLFLGQGLEACPLVLIESMSCGTPVLALSLGPVPEIVEQHVGGFHAGDLSELAQAFPTVERLDRSAVRRLAVERFDYRRMVDDYVQLFEAVASRT